MPQVTVHFTGLCLFDRSLAESEGVRVLLTDATNNRNQLPTGRTGIPHHAKLLVQAGYDKNDIDDYLEYDLERTKVEFVGPGGDGLSRDPLDQLADFGEFSKKVMLKEEAKKPGRWTIATAVIRGGELVPVTVEPCPPNSGKRWHIDRKLMGDDQPLVVGELAHSMKWETELTEIVLKPVGGSEKKIPVIEGGAIYFGNRPRNEDLKHWLEEGFLDCDRVPHPSKDPAIDHHFEWHYRLLESTSGERLEKRVGWHADGDKAPAPCDGDPRKVVAKTLRTLDPEAGSYPTCFGCVI